MKATKGFQLTFYTQQNRHHEGRPVGEWLIMTARSLGIRGATEFVAAEGFGHDHRLHSWHFFELADQPVEVKMAVTEQEAEMLFKRLEGEAVRLFYVKSEVEFGSMGAARE